MAIEQWLIDSPKTIDLELVRHVRVSLMAGSLDVIAHDEPGCRVEVSAVEGRDLKVAIEGDTLLIDHPSSAGAISAPRRAPSSTSRRRA